MMANQQNEQTIIDKEKKENMEKRKQELQAEIEKQNDRVNHLQTSAFALANYYFVFQGIILGPIVTATTALRCSDRWVLFSLSLIAGILNLAALLVIGGNYKRSTMRRSQTKMEHSELEKDLAKLETWPSDQRLTNNILSHWIQASEFKLPTTTTSEPEQRQSTWVVSRHGYMDIDKNRMRNFYFMLCTGLFLSFAIIVAVGCWTIPCKNTLQCLPPISNTSRGDKCIRVCEGANCMSICTEY